MKLELKFVAALLFFVTTSVLAAWSPEDREIFALREAVIKDYGEGTTFYSWLGVSKKATDAEITKAYRKLSRQLHPDKSPSKKANDRFARLGAVVTVLRGARRERYDFFIDHGFPKLKGTDYFYQRYRPGLGTVLIFLFFLVAVGQYGAIKITRTRQRQHMNSIIDEVREQAWGSGFPTTKRKAILPNGKVFVIYPQGTVFLVDNDVEYWLNPDEIKDPQWSDTILFKLPKWLITKTTGYKFAEPLDGKILGSDNVEDAEAEQDTKKKSKPKSKSKSETPNTVPKVGGARRRK